ncbi:sensor histidine kinase [Salisediminibacterium selenitireducens]|uniref:histidine kinase n=1 Tax=Bacillus selenitireducens (strain ATCC 700615 / DSM 15326 / MLS10) TaxID=439292 RepID=D6XT62_BACIE|nr:sensor histidine kinase [Salisediminibacterium selenitireducens]ADH98998.1 integral membrane sensor signal transduction histidine kinase [[Bacillus] selenitireducens MLS10]
MRASLRLKTWFFIVLFTLTSMVSLVFLTNYLYESFYLTHQTEQLEGRGNNLAQVYYQAETPEQLDYFYDLAEFMARCAVANIQITDMGEFNSRIPRSVPLQEDEFALTDFENEQLTAGETIRFTREGYEKDHLIIMLPLMEEGDAGPQGIITISTAVNAAFSPFESLRGILFLSMGVAFVVIVFVLHKMTNYVIDPIRRMIAASKSWGEGDFSQKVDVKTTDEIGQLADAFNQMTYSLDEADKKKQEFLGNVSHELRTPLSYLKGYSEVLLEKHRKGEALDEKHIEKIQAEGNRMEKLIHDLLDLARLEGDTYPMDKMPMPLAQLVEDVCERMNLIAEKDDVTVNLELDYGIIIEGDESRLEQVISNLIENAIRYGKQGKQIDVSLEQADGKAVLRVRDYGAGMPPETLTRLTERFYRVDRTRSKQLGGTGLGLTIVNEIVKKHDGQLSFESVEGEGATAIVQIPCFDDEMN